MTRLKSAAPPSREPQFHAGMLRAITRALVALGHDPHPVLASTGLKASDLDGMGRVPHSIALRLFEEAVRVSGEPAFGLVTGMHSDLADYGLLGALMVTAPTVGGILDGTSRYARLLHDSAEIWGTHDGHRYLWHSRLRGVQTHMALEESLASGAIARLRLRLGPEWAPLEMWFPHAEPQHAAEYQRLFRCPVRFGAETSVTVLDAAVRALTNPVDTTMSELVERRAEAALRRMDSASSFTDAVRAVLLRALPSSSQGTDVVMRELHVSRATLTRKLADEDTTLTAVLDALRHELAIEYLRDPAISLEELARKLAFSDARALRRAFLRWTGETPADFRKRETPS